MNKLTRWEAINELVAVSDYIAERARDLRADHPDICGFMHEVRGEIGDFFEAIDGTEIMGFGIANKNDLKGMLWMKKH